MYIRQTDKVEQFAQRNKSDVNHPNNINCNNSKEHLKTCPKMKKQISKLICFYIKKINTFENLKKHYIIELQANLIIYR